MKSQIIQWYPGHIAKAEKQLSKNLSKVDLVIEVRDARIPMATTHPHLQKWIKGKQHILVINRKDMITSLALSAWNDLFKKEGISALWCNAQEGIGVNQIKNLAIEAGKSLNARRLSRGMRIRSVRALTLGFPNVGKSALINRLVKRKVVESSRRAGVTRSLRWVKLGQSLDLLDAPGVLPPKLTDQKAALRLAICDDIGEASYDIEQIAISFIEIVKQLELKPESGAQLNKLEKRYGLLFKKDKYYAHKWLSEASNKHTSGDIRRMSQRLIDDFRRSLLGLIALELP